MSGRWLKPVGRFVAWWVGIFVLLGGGGIAVCPCCGQTSCPGATASAGILAAVLAAVPALLGRIVRRLRRKKRSDATAG